MKSIERTHLISPLLLLGLDTTIVNGYVYSSGPLPRNPNKSAKKGGSSCWEKNDFSCLEKDFVDGAFRELQNELGDNRQDIRDWMTAMVDPVDKKTAKKWIEKAFDFAFEFNEDFATAEAEKDATEEFLQKSRDWVAGLYEEEDKEGDVDDFNEEEEEEPKVEDSEVPNKGGNTSSSPFTETKVEGNVVHSAPSPDKTDEIVPETPNSEDQSTKDIFRVSIDLPGVDRTDVDITLDGDLLLIRGKRDGASDELPTRIYTKKLSVSENEVDMERLEASLKNGVLVISAPKQKPTEIRRKIKVS